MPTPARTPRPSVELNEPLLTGDASQNESCRLASVAEIQEQVGANVTEMRGLTQPGAYGETMLSCTWYLDSTEIGIPSVTVQWEYPVGIWHDPVLDLYGQLVDQELAAPVPAIGEAAILQGVNAETLAGDRILRISVLMHVTPTADDQANAIDLLRLVLGRSYEAQPSPAP